jgi:predicted ester cyclase/heme-degrading monooxygenase HmoA
MLHVHRCIIMILLLPCISSGQPSTNKTINNYTTMTKTIQMNKEVVRTLYEQCLNKRNMKLLHEVVSPDYIGIRGVKGAQGFEEPVAQLIQSFPDIQWDIQELIAEDNQVVVKWKWEGTHTFQFTTFEPTNKLISNEGVAIFEIKDGKIIKSQIQPDRLGFLQAMEVVPQDPSTLSNKKYRSDQVNFIDKFFVPSTARNQFLERLKINRNLIKTLPGFIEDAVYNSTDDNGNLNCVTVALWENMEAVNKAKEVVQKAYREQGFDLPAMLQRLNITLERGTYSKMPD